MFPCYFSSVVLLRIVVEKGAVRWNSLCERRVISQNWSPVERLNFAPETGVCLEMRERGPEGCIAMRFNGVFSFPSTAPPP